MKKIIPLLLILIQFSSYSQESDNQAKSEEKYDYKVNGYVILNEYDRDNMDLKDKKYEAGHFRYNVIGEFTHKDDTQEFKYVLIQIVQFNRKIGSLTDANGKPVDKIKLYYTDNEIKNLKKKEKKAAVNEFYEIPNKLNYIDIGDQENIFWVKEEEFNSYLEKGYIKKRYYLTPQFAYGASLTIPFKIRPEVDDFNMKITPEISLGGYLGMRGRLSRYKSI
ncbi:MAG: hypothetical protein KDD26_10805, partial [Winogradskyella sp.]|nr:hypothetical protein [Winogradskyella sp.]